MANDPEVDLVIIGSHGRSGIKRLLLGSTAERVVQHALPRGLQLFMALSTSVAAKLDAKVPHGFGKVFVEAGRQNNIDPLILAAISAHESGAWKSRAARLKNNWMGLMARNKTKRFVTPEASIFCPAELLNRKPFTGHSSLASVARIYCATNPANWKNSVLQWRSRLTPN